MNVFEFAKNLAMYFISAAASHQAAMQPPGARTVETGTKFELLFLSAACSQPGTNWLDLAKSFLVSAACLVGRLHFLFRYEEETTMKRHTSYLFLACTFVAASAPAATIQVSPNPPVSAPVIVDATTGADMAGLIVTPTYLFPDGPLSLSFTWTRIDATSGAAMDPNGVFRAWVDGDTSGSLAWHYESMFLSPLLSLEFDGTAAGIYFDRSSPNPGTPGSGPGGDIIFGEVFPPGIDSGFVVTYSSMVSVGGNSAQGDLYAKLRFDFGGLPNGWLDPGGITNFTQDTDHVSPEPASALLVLCGLALYAVVRSRLPRGHITQLGSFAQHARLP